MKNRIINIAAAACLLLVCGLIVRSQTVTAASGDSNFSKVVASTEIAARTFATTLSSGTGSINYGSGTEPVGCSGYYAQATQRSFAINFGHVASQRTMTVYLGGGGTTNDAIAGYCRTKEIR